MHLCVLCTWSGVLAVDDVAYSTFSSSLAVYSILEKNVLWVLESPEKVLYCFLIKRVGTLGLGHQAFLAAAADALRQQPALL